LEEIVDLNKLIATFSKQVVEKIILLFFLGGLVDLGKQFIVYCKGRWSLNLYKGFLSPFVMGFV
jgi:hypothetical protein